ncbi:uncharacterized protein LOC111401600 [Olea europaea var. sylvestris]|uniref:Uncharacterized protein n=1 Tax=Olea europaea subsp. europaea TaxID=158383 RepID=A0A8S0TWM2_OLEEU|nr:uncharacterized protein LOC111401600 [Olea europaea var. sylvestris]CAA3010367.1 Hypothetical predicted protein [Olea europaea subsp. europaea]
MVVVDSDSTIAKEEEEVAEPLPRTPVALSISLIQREKTQCHYATSAVPPPPNIPWSMVAIRDYGDDNNNSTIIFPPINHENLQISKEILQVHGELSITSPPCNDENSESDSDSNSNSSATFSPSDSSAVSASPSILRPKARSAADIALWFDSMVEILRSKVNNTARLIWSNLASTLKSSLTFRYATMVAMLLLFLYFRRRRIFRAQEGSVNQLIRVVKEKDEKINKLLDQITEMNRALLSFQKSSQ